MSKSDDTLALHQHYKQECNIENRTIFCHDNLEILQGINSECIALIYLDPPFNKKKVFTAPIGTSAEGASFKDIFTQEDVKDEWVQTIKEDHYAIYRLLDAVKDIEGRTSYNFCYLAYMAIRLIECERVLKDTGSLYLHCDPTMSHYLKLLLDCIFGESNFRNEVVWYYDNRLQRGGSDFGKLHDVLLCYGKSAAWFYREQYDKKWTPSNTQKRRLAKGYEVRKNELIIYDMEKAQKDNVDFSKYQKVHENAQAHQPPIGNVWTIPILNPMANERTGYPTQKPLALLERIINASSKEGDMVLDPFCGCATTCVAAEKLERHWIGVDISIRAYELVKERLKKEVANPENLFDYDKAIAFFTAPPKRTDSGTHTTDAKYVYVISHPNYANEYKVGIASNWKSRLTAYQTSDPDRSFRMEYTIHVSNYRELEQHIHQVFENKHEWVSGNLKDIIREIEEHANVPDREGGGQ